MPYSDDSNISDIRQYLLDTRPKNVLDVGAGAGKYGRLVRNTLPNASIEAVEVWEPYVKTFSLLDIYDLIHVKDVRELEPHIFEGVDLVIFGDVLEHMTKEEAVLVWDRARHSNRLISIPIVHYPQGHSHGNPYEEHVKDDWSIESVIECFNVALIASSDITGVFYAEAETT